MRKMICKQLGGVCDIVFQANTFEEVAEMSKKHGMEMLKKAVKHRLEAMNEIQELMQSGGAINKWMKNKGKNLKDIRKAGNLYSLLNPFHKTLPGDHR